MRFTEVQLTIIKSWSGNKLQNFLIDLYEVGIITGEDHQGELIRMENKFWQTYFPETVAS